ncbi:MAG: 50S ribosomal protein L23 [Candidatus Thermoplasmatota archaeon]|jgi:large subunit ribosomal protein L23|nr:50S ribosomal protein L23 [Candidatus Thermoplasmatota archaeon]
MTRYIYAPVATEKSMMQTERENKITFIVDRKATREEIKKEVEERFAVKVTEVNVMITKKGKKAVVRLDDSVSAEEFAGRIGIF